MSITSAIIGGTGLDSIAELEILSEEVVETPWGEPSAPLVTGRLFNKEWYFLPRHGSNHAMAPHKINYQANIWALKEAGVESIIAFAAVGAIKLEISDGDIIIPDQLIDYTWGRAHTFKSGEQLPLDHIDFTEPYSTLLRHKLIQAAGNASVRIHDSGVYAATQGPRLETAAEIHRLEQDGADIVGMTGMPEAALARELGINYACIAMAVNTAAGRGSEEITMELIRSNLSTASESGLALLRYM